MNKTYGIAVVLLAAAAMLLSAAGEQDSEMAAESRRRPAIRGYSDRGQRRLRDRPGEPGPG